MKRKILVLACVAALLCSLAACSLTQAQSISFARQPQSVFVVGDPVKIEDLIEVNVVLTDGTTRNDVPATVRGFDTSRAGVFTATVSYRGASIEFTYYVVNSLDGEFIGGTGTETDPYLIASAEQFKNIAEQKVGSYFELVADIDFGGETIQYALISGFSGSLEGNGRTIKGLRTDSESAVLFNSVENTNFSNFIFELDSPIALASIRDSNEETNFSKIIINGSKTTSAQNHGNFIGGLAYGEINFEDCVNNASMKGTSQYLAPFVGGYAYYGQDVTGAVIEAAKVTFTRCVNNADIEAQRPGSFVGNYWGSFDTLTFENTTLGIYSYTFNECQNNGRVIGTSEEASRIIGSAGPGDAALESFQQGITESGKKHTESGYNDNYIKVPTITGLIYFDSEEEGSELMIDFSKVPEGYIVTSVKVQMEFRTIRGFEPDSRWLRETSRFNVIEAFRKADGIIGTGFRNWSVVSAETDYLAVGKNEDGTLYVMPNYYCYSPDTYTPTEGGNYQYIKIGDVFAYYYVGGDYYVYDEGGWAKFTAFGYDANGNLVCCSSVVKNQQNTSLMTYEAD